MIAYGRIMQVMGTVNSAGFQRVALIAELPKGGEAVDDDTKKDAAPSQQ